MFTAWEYMQRNSSITYVGIYYNTSLCPAFGPTSKCGICPRVDKLDFTSQLCLQT